MAKRKEIQEAVSVELTNRIVGHGEKPPAELLAHPENWRHHSGEQESALTKLLEEIGWLISTMSMPNAEAQPDVSAIIMACDALRQRSLSGVAVQLRHSSPRYFERSSVSTEL